MTIPDFQTLMLPLLKLAGDGAEHSLREAVEKLSDEFSLSPEERRQLITSGRQSNIYNRVGWSGTYLKKAGLLEATRRSYFRITARGQEVLARNPARIDMKYLEQFPEYLEFRERSGEANEVAPGMKKIEPPVVLQTPEELMEEAYLSIRDRLAQDLISQMLRSSPAFFEHLVIDLLVKMGYGGTFREAARAVGKSGDEGIDGIIDEDRLGLDTIYIQAKKWDGNVGRPEVQRFVGALHGKHARKGIFITTASFTGGAREYAAMIDPKVVLIDGRRLADLMIDYNVGVSQVATYEIKRVDSDYFEEG